MTVTYLMIYMCRKTKKRAGSSVSSSDDLAPVVAADVKLPSICPAVVTSSLVSKAGYVE